MTARRGGGRGRGGRSDRRRAGNRAGNRRGPGARRGAGRSTAGAAGARRPAERSRGLGGEQVEGRQAVRELLLAGRRAVRELVVHDGGDELVDLARDLGVATRVVGRGAFDALARTEAPQGVLAQAEPLRETPLDELIGSGGDAPFLLALDGITDPGNLGAILRSAECAGVTGVVLPRHRAVHVTPAAAKAAAGAIEHLRLALVGGLPTALLELKEAGIWVVGLDAAGPQPVYDLPLAADPVALVVGSEGQGLARLTRERCDVLVHIPMRGQLSSLNAGAAAAVACFEIARRR